ncbi:MAG: hypothetical protein K0S23_2455 [Fluviicola sp.]|jgi:hypothetical protein|nr:hypothetical protein [Fluviicola sp.]
MIYETYKHDFNFSFLPFNFLLSNKVVTCLETLFYEIHYIFGVSIFANDSSGMQEGQ